MENFIAALLATIIIALMIVLLISEVNREPSTIPIEVTRYMNTTNDLVFESYPTVKDSLGNVIIPRSATLYHVTEDTIIDLYYFGSYEIFNADDITEVWYNHRR